MKHDYGDLPVPFYDLLVAFIIACQNYQPHFDFPFSVKDEPYHLRSTGLQDSLVEGCLRILAAKASVSDLRGGEFNHEIIHLIH